MLNLEQIDNDNVEIYEMYEKIEPFKSEWL